LYSCASISPSERASFAFMEMPSDQSIGKVTLFVVKETSWKLS